jgi:hypothetical protein
MRGIEFMGHLAAEHQDNYCVSAGEKNAACSRQEEGIIFLTEFSSHKTIMSLHQNLAIMCRYAE